MLINKMCTFLRKILININIVRKSYSTQNTIFALSSGYGKCGVAVIRVSGPQTGTALKALTKLKTLPDPRKAILKKIYNPNTFDVLDRGLILWFPGPNSFTGEDCCEFQVHGSVAVVTAIMKSLSSLESVRPADPGEFTRRAFMNGKMDLTEVEGLADLLQAETELQRKQAYLQTEGALSKVYNNWRSILIKSVANIEAFIDFEETETLDSDMLRETSKKIRILRENIVKHIDSGKKAEILRSGVKTVIVGEPNVGKSSLLNNLCQKPKAIVSPIEGTTRDLLEVNMDINGYPLILMDTAGLRTKTSDVIEKEGMRRAIDSIQNADFILFVIDITKYLNGNKTQYFEMYLKDLGLEKLDLRLKKYVVVLNKNDLIEKKDAPSDIENFIKISCKTNDGIDNLMDQITKNLENICGNPSTEHPSMNQERHRSHLLLCANYLQQFLEKTDSETADVVLMAQDLRLALRQLGKLTGVVTTEDLLDVIFKDFCIGK